MPDEVFAMIASAVFVFMWLAIMGLWAYFANKSDLYEDHLFEEVRRLTPPKKCS